MKSTQIWQLALTFSPEACNRFAKYIDSPYFNVDQRLVRFWAYLHQTLKQEEPNPGSKAEAFASFLDDEPYEDAKMRHFCSYLFRHMLDFCGQEQLKSRPFEKNLLVLEAMEKPGREKFFSRQERKISRNLAAGKRRDQAYFSEALRLKSRLAAREQRQMSRRQDQLLVESDRQLDLFYILSKLRSACSFVNNQQVLKRDDGGIAIKVLNESPDRGLSLNVDIEEEQGLPPAVQVYFEIYQSLMQPDDPAHYMALKKRLPSVSEVFAPEELRSLYTFAQNYCIRKINAGQQAYLEELFLLYVDMINEELLLENGTLSPWHYKNITVTALRLGKFDWVEDFLLENKNRIPETFRANAYTYNRAKLHFYRKEYPEVLRLLQQVEYEDLFYNLDSKAMILKTYFESGEWDALESMMESFGQYLRRNQSIPDKHRKNYRNLIRFVRKMNAAPNTSQLKELIHDLEKTSDVADKDWILKMLKN